MFAVLAKRFIWALPLLLIVSMLTFLLQSFAPGSVAQSMLATGATVEKIAELNHKLGYDRAFFVQYGEWLLNALQGDLGVSAYSNETVLSLIVARLPVTLSLTVLALVMSVFLGLLFGGISAVRGGLPGRIVDIGSVFLMSLPNFWLGMVLIAVVAANVSWLPTSGYIAFSTGVHRWLAALLLPVLTTAVSPIAVIALNARGELLTAMRSDFVRALRANGIPARRILLKHVLRNAFGPVLTIISLIFVNLLGGTLIVEQVYALPGIGRLAVTATNRHDIPVMQGIVVYYTIVVVIVFTINDLLLAYLNPKVQAQ
ncbi:ABC transporter permease [Rhizobium sp. ICMP 5592]|uniref:ABC transporter permease n=1 Tax=Rhizobium sp. ICMP 5592 TaxID=2292445 RepID=UPI0018868965|nr:ABC transporter permease [Rhizobium sp. ICMP 5592]